MTFQSTTLVGLTPMTPAPLIPLSSCDECFALLQPSDQSPHERWHQMLASERDTIINTLDSLETTLIELYQDVQKLKEASA